VANLCAGGCSFVTGNTVYRSRVMGIYVRTGLTRIYLPPSGPLTATVA
jgi:hypothetical protein